MLTNNELNARVKNLINSLITLKDYALTIERNMNEVKSNNINYTKNNFNNSMILKNNSNSFINDEFGNNNINNNLNLTYQADLNNYSFDENNQKNRELLNSMKNMLNHIDTKIYDENGELIDY